jgi:6-pyruvoyltetrahydropterin/6-carboxytetrahydropterin synthase
MKIRPFVTLRLARENMFFSAGHFMIFSHDAREHAHGHNYQLSVDLRYILPENGVSFDCQWYIERLSELCQPLNRIFLLPTQSPHLTIKETETSYQLSFNGEPINFPRSEVRLLPIPNISMESLVVWLLDQFILNEAAMLTKHEIKEITFNLASQPGISVSTTRLL